MAAQYTNITAEEMEQFLSSKGFARVHPPGTSEAVYGKRVHQGGLQLTLRVYTGIVGSDSREVGKDAIRVGLFMRADDGRIVKLGGSKRVHRVKNWRANLGARIDDWVDYLPQDTCKCGLPMVVRNSKRGKFLGCAGYPDCRETKPLPQKKRENNGCNC